MSSELRERKREKGTTEPENEGSKKYKDPVVFAMVIFRLICLFSYIFATIPFLWLVLPLRFFNPLFRKIGIQNTKLPTDRIQKWWSRFAVWILGFTVREFTTILTWKVSLEGTENVPHGEPLVFMYSHASNIDPFFLQGWSPVAVKFVFKRSLLWEAFWMFPMAYLYGHIPIDRQNREKAIASIEQAGAQINVWKRSVAISPEGTRSPTGEILEFKKGPFHLSLKSRVNIIPVVLFNNYQLWPRKQMFPLCGEVRVRFLPKIEIKADETVESLSDRVRSVMVESFKNKPEIKEKPQTIFPALIWLVFLFTALAYFGFF